MKKKLEAYALDVWGAKTVAAKRLILLDMVEAFQHKSKQAKFKDKIAKAGLIECDFIASNLALNDTDAVIK